MAYNIVHAGSKLYKLDVSGVATEITMPAGVTMSATRASVMAVLDTNIVVCNGPSVNLRVDSSTLTATPLSLVEPPSVSTLSAGAAGVLTGDYSYKWTFAQMDGATVISESPLAGPTATITVSGTKIHHASIPVSSAASCNARRAYRTTSGGSTWFLAFTIADNTTATYDDNVPDASLSTTAAPTDLGNPPGTTTADRITQIIAWADRLWAIGTGDLDIAYYSGVGRCFAWNPTQSVVANPIGQDSTGLVAFLPRRTELGLGKSTGLWRITGSTAATFNCEQFAFGIGVKAPHSVITIRDTCYFLSADGVYSWGPEGFTRLSQRVNAWFTSDSYFNREYFSLAAARWNLRENTYELHLPAAGSVVLDRWVSMDLDTQRWTGPHKTDAFTPSAVGSAELVTGVVQNMIGATSGHVYLTNYPEYADDGTAIALDVQTTWHSGGAPELTKYFGQLTMFTGVETAGSLTVTPYVGGTDAAASASMTHDLTTGEERLARLGIGRLLSLRFQESAANQRVRLYGYQLPTHAIGQRG